MVVSIRTGSFRKKTAKRVAERRVSLMFLFALYQMAPYGMLFAFILLLAKNFKLINTDSTQWPLRSIFSWIILLLSSAAMLVQ